MTDPMENDAELIAHADAFLERAKAIGCEAAACVAVSEDYGYAHMGGDLCDSNFGAMVHQFAHVRGELLADQLDEADALPPEVCH